jgi:hypothetical protein
MTDTTASSMSPVSSTPLPFAREAVQGIPIPLGARTDVMIALDGGESGLHATVLGWIVQKLERGEVDDLLAAGASPETLETLRRLDARLQVQLAHARRPFISIGINLEVVEQALGELTHADQYRDLVAYFVQHGATNAMLRELFGMTRQDIEHTRQILLSANSRGGRTPLPSHDERAAILRAWDETQRSLQLGADLPIVVRDRRTRFKRLHAAMGQRYNLATLYAVVCDQEVQ